MLKSLSLRRKKLLLTVTQAVTLLDPVLHQDIVLQAVIPLDLVIHPTITQAEDTLEVGILINSTIAGAVRQDGLNLPILFTFHLEVMH